jgi:hypothetical protein
MPAGPQPGQAREHGAEAGKQENGQEQDKGHVRLV